MIAPRTEDDASPGTSGNKITQAYGKVACIGTRVYKLSQDITGLLLYRDGSNSVVVTVCCSMHKEVCQQHCSSWPA